MAKCRNNKIGSTPLQLAPQTARISCAWHATIPFPGGCQWRERDAAPKGPTIYKTHRIIVADYFIIALFPGAHEICVCVCVCCVLRAALTLFVCVYSRACVRCRFAREQWGDASPSSLYTHTHTHWGAQAIRQNNGRAGPRAVFASVACYCARNTMFKSWYINAYTVIIHSAAMAELETHNVYVCRIR